MSSTHFLPWPIFAVEEEGDLINEAGMPAEGSGNNSSSGPQGITKVWKRHRALL